ncbi:MAG: hypothetical protein RL199_1399 [Pseudomonadota bacterium]|jgi:hypothetical protein
MTQLRASLLACGLMAASFSTGCLPRTGIELEIGVTDSFRPGVDFKAIRVTVETDASTEEAKEFQTVGEDEVFPLYIYVWAENTPHSKAKIKIEATKGADTVGTRTLINVPFEEGRIVQQQVVLTPSQR